MSERQFVSRAGDKLAHALDVLDLDVAGLHCADLGCHVGGFTDCLLQRGAASVHSVDTAWGQLAWALRSDGRVTVMERTNALHVDPPRRVDLVVVDLGWTPQQRAINAALRWVDAGGRILTLVKPHYELDDDDPAQERVGSGLTEEDVDRVLHEVRAHLESVPATLLGEARSPLRGAKSGRRGAGNPEHFLLLESTPS